MHTSFEIWSFSAIVLSLKTRIVDIIIVLYYASQTDNPVFCGNE